MPTGDREYGVTRRKAAAIAVWVLASVFLLSAPTPARADLSDIFKNLFGGNDQAGTSPDEGASEEEGRRQAGATAASPCPQNMVEITGLTEGCGTDRPPASHAVAGDINGLWDVEAPGNPFYESALVTLNRGSAGVGYRAADAAWVAAGVARNHNETWFGGINPTADEAEDGSLRLHLATGGYCGCVPYLVTVKPTGDPNIMVGEWTFDYDSAPLKKGFAVIRRRPPGNFRSVSYRNITADPAQAFARDVAAFGTRSLKIERDHPVSCGYGQMRGNCGGIWVTILGDNLAGGHDVWIDPASHIEIEKAGWLCGDGSFSDYGSGWISCGSTQAAGDGVVGLAMRLLFRLGMTPGARTLWVDGQPVHLEVTIHGFPEEDKTKKPAMVLLDALNMQGEQITQIEEGEPFILEAVYDGAHPDSWISIDVPNVGREQAAAEAETREVVLRRTDDPKIFRGEWLAVEAGPPAQ